MDKSMKTPLARVRGLGSAKSGVAHWYHQRLSALALIPLTCWMIYLVYALSGANYEDASALLSSSALAPVNITILLLFILMGFWHAALGLQVVLEDYIAHEGVRFVSIIAMRLGLGALAMLALVSILKISFVPL